MSPRFPGSDVIDGGSGDVKSQGERACAVRGGPNFSDSTIGQFRGMVVRALLGDVSVAAFFSSIFGIGFGGSQKQMGWIAAGWIIASVQHMQTGWNRAVMYLPRQSVGGLNMAFAINSERTVSGFLPGGLPLPAIVWAKFLHALPKSLVNWRRYARGGKCGTFRRTKATAFEIGESVFVGALGVEDSTASFARFLQSSPPFAATTTGAL